MKKTNILSKHAVTIVEAMIVILILTIGLVWVYKIYIDSVKMVNNLENKIQAIQIAREWIEAVMNIRDTNWMSFPLNKKDCWMVLDYNSNCMSTDSIPINSISINGSYKVYRDNSWSWKLVSWEVYDNYQEDYQEDYKVMLDDNWLYTQSWGLTNTTPEFTRQIKVDNSGIGSVIIQSIVRWVDSVRISPQEVKLEVKLRNYNE
jgi:hypothetical protein